MFNGQSLLPIDKEFEIPDPFKITPFGLKVVGNPTYEEWVECGRKLKLSRESIHFWIGDWLLYGEQRWGDKYALGEKLTGFSYQTLANDKSTAAAIPLEKRR